MHPKPEPETPTPKPLNRIPAADLQKMNQVDSPLLEANLNGLEGVWV